MAAVVALLAVLLQEPVPSDAAFIGEVNSRGQFYQCRDLGALQLDIARKAGIRRIFVPATAADKFYKPDLLPAEFKAHGQVVGIANIADLVRALWAR